MYKQVLLLGIAAFTLCFSVYTALPSSLFFNNLQDFYVSYDEILIQLIKYTSISFVIIFFIGLLFLKINKKLYVYYLSLIVLFLIIIFIDTNIFDVNVLMNGSEKEKILSVRSILNILLIVTAIIAVYLIIKKTKYEKHFFVIIIVSLVVSMLGFYTGYSKSNYSDYLARINADNKTINESINSSGDDLLVFSKEKNILYIILDTFDASYLKEILDGNYNEYNDILKDFTFFTNYVSVYSATKGTGIAQFAGEIYKNDQEYELFREKVFSSGKSFFEIMKQNNWDNRIYPDQHAGAGLYAPDIDLYSNKTNNIDNSKFIQHLVNTSFYKITPVILRNNIRQVQTSTKSGWDFKFLEILDNKNIKLSKNNQFILLHLHGAHVPYTVDENMNISNKATSISQSMASLKMVNILLKKLKDKNLYDNTAIFIVADHGGVGLRFNPVMLFKGYDEKNNNIRFDDSPVYQTSIKHILEQCALSDKCKIDRVEDNVSRLFFLHDGLNLLDRNYFPPMIAYKIPNDIHTISTTNDLEEEGYYPPAIQVLDVSKYQMFDFVTNDLPKNSLGNLWEKSPNGIKGRKNIWIKLDSAKKYPFIVKFYGNTTEKLVEQLIKVDNSIIYDVAAKVDNNTFVIENYFEAKDFINFNFQNEVELNKIELIPIDNNTQELIYNVSDNRLKIKLSSTKGIIKINYKSSDIQDIIVKQNKTIVYKDQLEKDSYFYLNLDDLTINNKTVVLDILNMSDKIKIDSITQYINIMPMDYYAIPYNRNVMVSEISNMNVFSSGFYQSEVHNIWAQKNFELNLPLTAAMLNQERIDVILNGFFYFNNTNDMQGVQAYIGDELIGEIKNIDSSCNKISLSIDKEKLKSNLKIDFKGLYAVSPKEKGINNDTRRLFFMLKSISIESPIFFKIGEYSIKDMKTNNFKSNWYSKEPTLIWSSNNAVLTLPLSKELQEREKIFIDLKGRLYFNQTNDMQTLGIYADDTLLKEFEVINSDYNTYTIEVPKKYLKEVLNLTLRTKYNSSPKLDGRGDDSRLLGFALTGINIKKDNTVSAVQKTVKEEKVSYSQIFNTGEYIVKDIDNNTFKSNWYSKEPTLIWSSNNAELTLPLSKELQEQKSIFIDIKGMVYFNKSNDMQTLGIYADDTLLKEFEVINSDYNTYTVEVPKEYLKDVLNLTLRTKYNSSPKLDSRGDDSRLLGFALTGINIKKDNIVNEVQKTVKEEKVSYSQIFNTGEYIVKDIDNNTFKSNWYSKEPTLIWSSNNAVLTLPLSKELQEQKSIFIDIKGMAYFNKSNDMQTLGIYADDTLLKEFEVINNNYNTYTVEVPKKYLKDVLNLTLRTKYNSSPKLDSRGDDSRLLGFALTGINIKKENIVNEVQKTVKEEKVSYSQIFNTGEYLVKDIDNNTFNSNWYSKEPTLIWSSNNAELTLPLSKELQEQKSIFIDIKGMVYLNKSNEMQTLGIYADNSLLKEFEVINNNYNTYTVEVPKKYLKEVLNLTFRTKYNSSPKLDSRGDDSRLLGFALTGINIRNNDNNINAVQNEIKYGIKEISMMNGKGWYQPEPELIWARKNAELLIPVSNINNAASMSIILKGQMFISNAKEQSLSIYCKDKKINEYKVNDNNIYDYSFTVDVDKNMEYIPLKLEAGYEEQPKNTGESLDDRLLAFGIREIVIKWN